MCVGPWGPLIAPPLGVLNYTPRDVRDGATRATGSARRCMQRDDARVARVDEAKVVEVRVEGVFRALIELCSDGGELVPFRLAICESGDDMPLGASQPASSHVFRDIAARGQRLLACLGALAPADRLPVMRRWLDSYHDLFTTPCWHCGHHLWPAAASAATLLPPTVRCASGRAYHAHCFAECSLTDTESEWLTIMPATKKYYELVA